MNNITPKLDYLKETKFLLADAINSKGGAVSENASFREFATSIDNLSGSSSWTLPTELYKGMTLWIDSTCNTLSGFDESKPYLYPILRCYPSTISNGESKVYYKSTTSGSWNGRFLNLGMNGAFKVHRSFFSDPMTIEFVYKFTEIPSAVVRMIHAVNYLLAAQINDEGKFVCTFSHISNPIHEIELNKPYYTVIRYSSETGVSARSFPNGEFQENPDALYTAPSSSLYLGFGTGGSTSTSFSADYTYTNGYNFGMCRCWQRLLSDDELNKNWLEVQERFEF